MMNTHPQGGAANGVQRPKAGIDGSKEPLGLCIESTSLRTTDDAQGWNGLTVSLLARGMDVGVLVVTVGYERGAMCALQHAGVAVARLNPRQARDFVKAMGTLAKTDQGDARAVRDFTNAPAVHKDRA